VRAPPTLLPSWLNHWAPSRARVSRLAKAAFSMHARLDVKGALGARTQWNARDQTPQIWAPRGVSFLHGKGCFCPALLPTPWPPYLVLFLLGHLFLPGHIHCYHCGIDNRSLLGLALTESVGKSGKTSGFMGIFCPCLGRPCFDLSSVASAPIPFWLHPLAPHNWPGHPIGDPPISIRDARPHLHPSSSKVPLPGQLQGAGRRSLS
jgi:hypothetical protein